MCLEQYKGETKYSQKKKIISSLITPSWEPSTTYVLNQPIEYLKPTEIISWFLIFLYDLM